MSANPQFLPMPNAKTVTAVTVAVISLHALMGTGLMLMLMSSVPLPPVTVTPPLEIEFVKPPEPVTPPTGPLPMDKTPLATPVEPPTPTEPTPAKTILPTDNKPTVTTDKPTPTESKPPVIEPIENKPKDTEPTPTKETPPEPTVTETMAEPPTVKNTAVMPAEPVIADTRKSEPAEPFAHLVSPDDTAERQQAEQAEREKAEREATEKAKREAAEKARLAQEKQAQAEREAAEKVKAKQAKAAQAKAEREKAERERAEQQKAEQQKQARQANNKTDYSGKMQWKKQPNITLTRSLSEIGKRKNITNMTVRVSFSASGNVTDVAIIQSSGDSQIDTYLQRQVMKGTVHPHAPDGVAVAGTFILPIGINYSK